MTFNVKWILLLIVKNLSQNLPSYELDLIYSYTIIMKKKSKQ
jgi:hypothetical protein